MVQVNRERKTVRKRVATVDVNYVTLGTLLKDVQDAIGQWGENAFVEEYQHSYSDDSSYGGIFSDVLETDEEMATRIADEERWADAQEKRDQKDYARLKAKFG